MEVDQEVKPTSSGPDALVSLEDIVSRGLSTSLAGVAEVSCFVASNLFLTSLNFTDKNER